MSTLLMRICNNPQYYSAHISSQKIN